MSSTKKPFFIRPAQEGDEVSRKAAEDFDALSVEPGKGIPVLTMIKNLT